MARDRRNAVKAGKGAWGCVVLVVFCASLLTLPARAETSSRPRKPTVKRPNVLDTDEGTTFYPYKLSSYLGMTIYRGSALAIGEQFGYAPFDGTPLYFGPAVDFSLYSPGYLFSVLGGGWYEFRIYGSPRLGIAVGALGGVGFTSNLGLTRNPVPEGFLQGAIIQDIDDLFSIRGEFRPGIVDTYFAFQMNIDVCFRFY